MFDESYKLLQKYPNKTKGKREELATKRGIRSKQLLVEIYSLLLTKNWGWKVVCLKLVKFTQKNNTQSSEVGWKNQQS